MTDSDVRDFLQHGTRTGKLAYTGGRNRPLVAPVWFVVEGEEIVFNTGKGTAKGRSLQRDPRTTLLVDLEEPPYGFVQAQGEVTLSEDPGELLRTATAVASRYVDPGEAEQFGRRNGVPGELVVRLRPTRVLAEFDVMA